MKTNKKYGNYLVSALLIGAVTSLSGCAHDVTFQQAHYNIATEKQQGASVTAVIDSDTLTKKVSVRSFMTGIAHNWEVEPGDMLKQVADIELPQMFSYYGFSTKYQEPTQGTQRLVLKFNIPSYNFDEFRAKVKVHVVAYGPSQKMLLDKTYAEEGETQGGKMFWGGAFAMKSAIRQSSLDAYKKIFADMRNDLERSLKDPKATSN